MSDHTKTAVYNIAEAKAHLPELVVGITEPAKPGKRNGLRDLLAAHRVDMLDHDRALAKAFVREFSVSYPSLYDASGAVAAAYEVDSPPSFVLVDQRGIVVGRYPGEASAAQIQSLIDQKLVTSSAAASASP